MGVAGGNGNSEQVIFCLGNGTAFYWNNSEQTETDNINQKMAISKSPTFRYVIETWSIWVNLITLYHINQIKTSPVKALSSSFLVNGSKVIK